ncbi:MAG: diadenylate cyclase CdaA [Defluviitaleaceae bacterium]|nr:diadenylate cyclase CdaA [Defluviitaleaceae bacterium]
MVATFFSWIIRVFNMPPFHVPSFSLAHVLDVFIVAVLIYLIFRWIRRTQAWVLFRGVVIVLIVALLAEIFDLFTVGWIVNNAISMGLVVVVILFQPELRKVLEQIGRGQYLINFKTDGEEKVHTSAHTVDEIVKASTIMSQALTGALIVLEQEVDLSEHERSGVPLDAQVSVQLLTNIFERNTPLHDGAVIIRSNRVSTAMCILPLTAETLDSSLGTRHRAGIGITEVSDARVVVVSEETGTVSVVVDGKITRGISEGKMRELLTYGEPVKARFSLFKSKGKGRR